MMLADAVQEANGKLFILGGGWSVTGPQVPPSAMALKIEVPWDQANRPHSWSLRLLDEDGHPARLGPDQQPMIVEGNFEVGRPPGLSPGTAIDVPIAIGFPPLPLEPGRRYVWALSINDESNHDWVREFSVRPAD
jgi:hypothetical protein